MKRISFLIFALAFCLFYSSCKKDESFKEKIYQDPYITSAIAYLKTQISSAEMEKFNLDAIKLLRYNGKVEGAIVTPKEITNHKKIVIDVDSNGLYTGNWFSVENNGSKKVEQWLPKVSMAILKMR